MNTKPANAIALYTVFSDEFVQREIKNYKYPLKMLLKRDITVGLLKYALKHYFNIDADPDKLNNRTYFKLKEYEGLHFAYKFNENWVMIAMGDSPLKIGYSCRSLYDDWKPIDDYFHVNEHKEYEQSGYSDDTLCYICAKKGAFMRLHNIENPSGDPFDSEYIKECDSTTGEYSLLRFDYFNLMAYYVAVTGKAEFAEVPIEKIYKTE